ncbi:Laccase abr2 [Penicillium verhagenii]|uniref:Laccase abr2 n=1 Tax=Penicillium verhagenii TaxID=1562060 RepID=UPI0025453A1D|nr:Laccase abr2 [Penicillium verhagenii]KAJ5948228.1 Laccase abr2 [Penicillium verhagenii]
MKSSVATWVFFALGFVQWACAEIVYFSIYLTWAPREVAGFTRDVILVNGQYPGPQLSLVQGDEVIFDVRNECPFNVTVHFHGIEQLNTPWSDGVPGMSQIPIDEGDSFRYQWTAHQYGAYFYHAHHRGQIEDGLYGPIYIEPSNSEERPFSMITTEASQLQAMLVAEEKTTPVLLSDWRLLTSEQIWAAEEASGVDAFCANALLINGKGSVYCFSAAELDALTTDDQKSVLGNESLTDIGCFPPDNVGTEGNYTHDYNKLLPTMFYGCTSSQSAHEVLTVNKNDQYVSWDLTSTAGILHLMFSVDEHDMYVYAVDGRYIQPVLVNAINLPSATRYSVLVPLNQVQGDYTIRMVSGTAQQIINTTATLQYEGKSQLTRPSIPWITTQGTNATADTILLDDTTIVPFPAVSPDYTIDQTFKLHIDHFNASYLWTLGNTSFNLELEESQPLLFNQTAIPSDLIIKTKNGTWVDLIVQVGTPLQPAHPIHKHSNKHFVIGQGDGDFTWDSVADAILEIPDSFNLVNPPMRDTSATPIAVTGPVWMALRYQVVNPGAFLMHCHIQVHQDGGMALAILDGVDAWPTIPTAYLDGSGF